MVICDPVNKLKLMLELTEIDRSLVSVAIRINASPVSTRDGMTFLHLYLEFEMNAREKGKHTH